MADLVPIDAPMLPPGFRELATSIHPIYGGIILFGAWFLFQVVRSFLQYMKEKGVTDRAALEATTVTPARMLEIQIKELARLSAVIEEEGKRHRAEVKRLDARLEAKAVTIERQEADIARLSEDRDRGWNLAREVDDVLHQLRHDCNNKLQTAYGAGTLGVEPPAPFPAFPPMLSRKGKSAEGTTL